MIFIIWHLHPVDNIYAQKLNPKWTFFHNCTFSWTLSFNMSVAFSEAVKTKSPLYP